LLAARISPKTFFQYSARDVMNFLVNYSVIRSNESCNEIECLHKLSQIDGKILKYVTTAQSLYV